MRSRGITLLELIIATILMVIVSLALLSIDTFSRHHMINSDRRSRLQNEIAFALENMNKYVLRGVRDANGLGLTTTPPGGGTVNGFRVRADLNNTPSDLTDDLRFDYVLNANTLTCDCAAASTTPSPSTPTCPKDCPVSPGETLSKHIVNIGGAGVQSPVNMPSSPANSGYYLNITDNGSAVEVGLAARWDPTIGESIDNPQVAMKTKMCSGSSSAR